MNKSTLLFLLSIICILFSCKRNEQAKKETHGDCNHDYDTTRIVRSNDERLSNHFAQHEITPNIVINNIDSSQTTISLPGHQIKWIDTPNEKAISIDNKKIILNNQITTNEVHNSIRDTLNTAINWTQIKLYNHIDREIIAIKMSYFSCDDPSCYANFYLLYDTKNKTESYFGAFHSNFGMNLYNFDNDKISFISQSHLMYPACDAKIYSIYAIDDKGNFTLQTKKDGKPYQIEQNYTDEGFKEFERLEQSDWIKKIE